MRKSYYTMFVFHGSSEEIEQVAKMHDIRLGEIERLEEVTVYQYIDLISKRRYLIPIPLCVISTSSIISCF